jgi:hypothetical protein
MALNDRTIPYEILIRFDDQGAVGGAHLIKRRIVELDGERLKDEVGLAQPVAIEGEDAPVLRDVLDEALTLALADNAALRARIAALEEAPAAGVAADAGA